MKIINNNYFHIMDWVLACISLIVWSSIMYLSIRNIDKSFIPIEVKNITMFFAPVLPLLIYNIINWIETIIEIKYLIILFFSAIFLAWIASIASLISMKTAPNPGYPLMLSKSYVIYTLIFSYFFLWSELSLKKTIVILFVVFFSFLIIYNKNKTHKTKDKKWLLYALYSFLWWWNLAIVLTYLIQQWIASTTINLYLHLFVSIFIIWEIIIKKVRFTPKNNNQIINLIIIWCAYILFQQSMIYWYSVSPNPGYINAANTASIWIITILSWIIFKDDLSKRNLIWVVWIIISLVLLFIL